MMPAPESSAIHFVPTPPKCSSPSTASASHSAAVSQTELFFSFIFTRIVKKPAFPVFYALIVPFPHPCVKAELGPFHPLVLAVRRTA